MTKIDRSKQLNTTGSALDTLRREAVALIPARHSDGDAAWVEVTETLRHHGPTTQAELAALTPAKLAAMATASLDQAAADWAAEQAHLAAQDGALSVANESEMKRDAGVGRVMDYDAGSRLTGAASVELAEQSEQAPSGAVCAYRDERGVWQYVQSSQAESERRQGREVRTVYVD